MKCESEPGVTGVAPGKTVPTGLVCHIPISELVSQSLAAFSQQQHAERLFWHPAMQRKYDPKKKKEKSRANKVSFIAAHSFYIQVNAAAAAAAGTPTPKCTKTRIQAQDSHIPAAVSVKHKQERVHTHTAAHSRGDDAVLLTCFGGLCLSGSGRRGE